MKVDRTREQDANMLKKGLNLLALHKYEAVHAQSIAMIKVDVNNPTPYFLLAILAADHHNFAKACELFEKSIELAPNTPRFLAQYARLLTQMNDQISARDMARKAGVLEVDDADVADMIGVVFSRTGLHAEAVPMFERAISLNPNVANMHYNLGASQQFSGDFEGAKESYLTALNLDPNLFRAWSSLVSLSKQTQVENHMSDLTHAFSAGSLSPDAKLHIGHALAKTYEDLGQFEESLAWLGKAKQDKHAELNHDIGSDLRLFEAAKHTANLDRTTQSEHAPIFVVGMPRTGTTLVDRILSSHPDVVSAGELNTFAGLVKSASGTDSNLVLDAETLNAATKLDLRNIAERYWQDTTELRRGAPRMTDKMPLNFFYVGLIHAVFPNARIIALRRGAMDSCLSNYRQLFSTGFSYYNYSLSLSDTAKYYTAFDDLMAHWRTQLPADCFAELHYEDIVFDQENQTRRLLAFAGLEWFEGCLRFHENAAPVSTASSVQVRQPLYSGSIGRWKKYGAALDGLRSDLGINSDEKRD